MRIVHIIPGKVWGGAEQYILDLTRHLRMRGHEVSLIAVGGGAVPPRLDQCGEIYRIFPEGMYGKAKRLGAMLNGADVVHVHDSSFVPVAVRAARHLGTCAPKVIFTRHIARQSRVLPWQRRYYREIHRVIFVSGLARRLWQQANPFFPDERCVTIINSVAPVTDDAKPSPSIRQTHGIPAGVPLIMFTGRVRKSKGCATIIEALSRLAHLEWEMVFVGACKPASYADTLASLARKAGIGGRVHFHGFATDVKNIIQEADIAVLPSIVREACPLSPMEFMQAGVPVIATGNGAQPEYITDDVDGILVEPADAAGLAKAIASLLNDTERRRTIARAGHDKFVNSLSYRRFVDAIEQVYMS